MPLVINRDLGFPIFFRKDTSDRRVIQEVVYNRTYRKKMIGFDVEPGEHWLDLGANIGAFGIYCRLHNATAHCFEPEPDCFEILKRNCPNFKCERSLVTTNQGRVLELWVSNKKDVYHRGTIMGYNRSMKKEPLLVPNKFIGSLKQHYDGIKMDIEGSELSMLDNLDLLPSCDKMCLEYHFSRDQSMDNLKRRLDALRERFPIMHYVAEVHRMLAAGGNQKSFWDRLIWCKKS